MVATLLLANASSAAERLTWVWPRINPKFHLYVSDPDGMNERALLPGPESNYNASFSQDGRWIVFTSERFGSADLFRVHPDGTGLERLTEDKAFDDQGALSPDGRSLAFVSTRDGGFANIWLLQIGTRKRPIQLTRATAGNFRPSWSPDGKWIAFSSERDTPKVRYIRGNEGQAWELLQTTAVYVVHPDGTGLKRITALDGNAGSPKWSRDGRSLLFTQVPDMEAMRHFILGVQIVSLDIETGARSVHLDGSQRVWAPSFIGPDDVGYGVGDPASAQPSEIRYLSGKKGPVGTSNPSWSADGSTLVYDRLDRGEQQPIEVSRTLDRHFELIGGTALPSEPVAFMPDSRFTYLERGPLGYKIRLRGTDNTMSDPIFDGTVGGYRDIHVSLSADGRMVAFDFSHIGHPEEQQQIAVMRTDGTDFKVVTSERAYNGFPSLSPDGKQLVYRVMTRNGPRIEHGLRRVSLADGKITPLTTEWDNFPVWSPRGDLIAFTGYRTGDFEIYTIHPDGTGLKQLTNSHGNDAHPVWSPDGKWIAFVSSRKGSKEEGIRPWWGQTYGEIFVMRFDGTHVRQLTDNQWEEGASGWAPASLRLPR
jgi:Tol biopolymer transport system component